MLVSFTINDLPELNNYNNDEINTIAKNLFIDWYKKQFTSNSNIDDKLDVLNARLSNQITTSISSFMTNINSNIDQLNTTTKEIYGLSKSNKKGELFENSIEEFIKNNLQNYSYSNTAKTSHCADGLLESNSGLKCLVEIKNYTDTVNSYEVDKLKSDMKTTGIKFALMLSSKSAIQGKKNIDIEHFIYENISYYIVYVSYIFEEVHKIQSGILLLENIYSLNTEKTINTIIEKNISKDLEELTVLIDSMTNMKSKFLNMEKIMREQMDNFYVIIRETEINLKKKIQSIWSNIKNEFKVVIINNDKIIEKYQDQKIFGILSKINDIIFQKYNLQLEDIDKLLNIYHKNIVIAELKIQTKKIEIVFIDSDIKISITEINISKVINYINIMITDIINRKKC